MVSMKDIAQRCGVSVATVSKALNGQPDIGEETRRRFKAPQSISSKRRLMRPMAFWVS